MKVNSESAKRQRAIARRMMCVAAVVLFWIAALWGISVWAGQSC